MRLLFPLGLLGLIAVPLLIIIYIIKNKYTEQVVSSTYIWTLSEKFLKRRNPINKIAGIISLILQILAVIFISFAIAQPVFTLHGAALDYCFVLDGSGSMNITRSYNETRLDAGKNEVENLISSSANGSSYTLVYVTETAEIIYEEVTDRTQAVKLLNDLKPRYGTSSTVDALGTAQKYFDANPSVKTYLVTDKIYLESQNVQIIGLGREDENYSVSNLSEPVISGGELTVNGSVYSYSSDKTLTLQLYIDETLSAELPVDVVKGVEKKFEISAKAVGYTSVRVAVKESDALALDNDSVIYNVKDDISHTTLIVSDTPFFIQAVLGVADVENNGDSKYVPKAVTTEEYENNPQYGSGYGLYIFDGYSPAALPSDGAVWFFNPQDKVVERTGFTAKTKVEMPDPGVRLVASTDSNPDIRTLLDNLIVDDNLVLRVKSYVPCTFHGDFIRLFSYGNSPVIFAGTNEYGNREVVFAFSLHETDFALNPNFSILSSNLMKYTFPQRLTKSTYFSGERVSINVPSNCDSIKVVSPSGATDYLDTDRDVAEFALSEVGNYTITFMNGNSESVVNVRADLPMEERLPLVSEASFSIVGEAENNARDGVYDDLLYLFIILAVLYIADWMVYCYEQYQLK